MSKKNNSEPDLCSQSVKPILLCSWALFCYNISGSRLSNTARCASLSSPLHHLTNLTSSMKAFLYSPVQSHPPVLRFLNQAGYCAVSDCRTKLSLFAQEMGAAHSQVLTLLSLSGVAATCSSKSSSVSMLTNSSPISAARKNKTIFVRVLSLEYFTWSNTSKYIQTVFPGTLTPEKRQQWHKKGVCACICSNKENKHQRDPYSLIR